MNRTARTRMAIVIAIGVALFVAVNEATAGVIW